MHALRVAVGAGNNNCSPLNQSCSGWRRVEREGKESLGPSSGQLSKISGIDAKEALIITYVSVSMLYVVDKKVDDVCD